LPSVWNTMKPLLFWNWKLMAPSAEEVKEGSNIKQKDVAEVVLKLDAKHNVKATAQGKGQKKNHVLIEGSDNGTISPVIQSTNQSRVPSLDQELMCTLKEKIQDPMWNTKWNGSESPHDVFCHDAVQSCGHVVTRVSHHDETCAPCKQSCQ